MSKALLRAILWMPAALWLALAVHAADEAPPVDHLELAALMLRDGNLDRAATALAQVDLQAEETDLQRFHILSGLLHVRRAQHGEALDAFARAMALGEVDAVIHVHRAQSAFALERYALAIEALDDAGPAIARIASVYHMRAQSHWLLGQRADALAVMQQAAMLFPADRSFPRRRIFYLIDMGLHHRAAELGRAYLARFNAEATDHIAIANALRFSGDLAQALFFLEAARLKFPDNADVTKSLAAAYIQEGHYHSAAALIHDAALRDPVLLPEAAELYRRAGLPFLALSLNSRITDQAEKLKQRLAILIELGHHDQAVAMIDDIRRVRIDADESIRYALAYALFKSGQFDRAESYLAQISQPELFKKAIELRKAMQDCDQTAWRCQ